MAQLGRERPSRARHGNTPACGRYHRIFSLGMTWSGRAWVGRARLGRARHGGVWQHAYQ